MKHIFTLLTALLLAPLAAIHAADAAQTGIGTSRTTPADDWRVDFRFAPERWQTAICLPDDWQKSLVGKQGDLRYDYANLLKHLGETDEIQLYDRMQHLAVVKESVLNRLRADTRYVFANAPAGSELKVAADGSWADEWGIRRKPCGLYDEACLHPLAGCDLAAARAFRFPDPLDKTRFAGVRDKARHLHETTGFALIAGNPATLFYLTSELVGFEEYLEKLLTDRIIIETLVDRMLGFWIEFFGAYLDAVGEFVEMIWMGDDWGMQQGPIIPPKLFREIFLPRYRQFCAFVKKRAPVKIALHSCGAVAWALEDFAGAGIDVVHPLQGDARGMEDPEMLKRRFGKQLAFYSNLCNQTTLPHGTPEQVREDVMRKLRALAPGGGYIVSAGHNIQADVPPANVLALFDTAFQHGQYPIVPLQPS